MWHTQVEPDEEKEEGLTELRREASAAFAQFLGTAAALGDETGNAERGTRSLYAFHRRRLL